MRTSYSIKNISISFIGQIITILIAFPTRTIFINTLGSSYLGINGLLTNIISIFSLADLGIGTAIIYSLYKPIFESDYQKISKLMNFYRNAYILIGIFVFILGLFLCPFLPSLIKNQIFSNSYLYTIFFLFLFNSVLSYLFSYKRSIIIASQKSYIVNTIHYFLLILLNLFQMLFLILTKNFIIYLVLQIIFTFLENIIISIIANRKYQFLKINNREKLSVTEKKIIFTNVKALILHKVGSITLASTDNIVISSFVGINWVGIYSNYLLISNALVSILNQMLNSLTASIGSLILEKETKKKIETFEIVFFFFSWLVGFCSICLWELLNPFISFWVGKEYLLSNNIVLLIVMNFYITCMRNPILIFKNAAGLFKQDRFKPIIEALINAILSVALVSNFGISGVLISTLISIILTSLWVEPFIVYKYIFKIGVKNYFFKFLIYVVLITLIGFITDFIIQLCGYFFDKFFSRLLLCILVPNFIFFLVFRKSNKMNFLYNFINLASNKVKNKFKEVN